MTSKNRGKIKKRATDLADFLSPGLGNELDGGVGVSKLADSLLSPNSSASLNAAKHPSCQLSPSEAALLQLKSDYCFLKHQAYLLDTYLSRYQLTDHLHLKLRQMAKDIHQAECAANEAVHS